MKFKLITIAALLSFFTARGQVDLGEIIRTGQAVKPIPVSMSGFSGEVDSVLRFDLFVMGFEFVTANPQFVISGKNSANVQGQVNDARSRANILSKAYNGGSLRQQAHALANDIVFAITGQKGIANTQIAFRLERGGIAEIGVADFDGYGTSVITTDKSLVAGPAWVPGRSRLLYASWKSGPTYIFSQDVLSGKRQVFASHPGNNYSPAVSPDGRKVAMILTKDGNPDLWVCNIDGSGLKNLTPNRAFESGPCWSPDSTTICYISTDVGVRSALCKIPAGGGEARNIKTIGLASVTEPDWSPDGRFIICTATAGGAKFDICLVPVDGGEAKRLVAGEDPSWAPNSRTVIFTRRENNKRVLSLLDVPTKRVKDCAQISGSSSQPSWSR